VADIRFRANGVDAVLDIDKVMFAEARAVERVTGKTFREAIQGLTDGSIESMQAIVWLAFKRKQPELKFSDIDSWAISDVQIPDDLGAGSDTEPPAEDESPDPTVAGPSPADEN
jgi:hypothetical protein